MPRAHKHTRGRPGEFGQIRTNSDKFGQISFGHIDTIVSTLANSHEFGKIRTTIHTGTQTRPREPGYIQTNSDKFKQKYIRAHRHTRYRSTKFKQHRTHSRKFG